jgi:hypothetical protein
MWVIELECVQNDRETMIQGAEDETDFEAMERRLRRMLAAAHEIGLRVNAWRVAWTEKETPSP